MSEQEIITKAIEKDIVAMELLYKSYFLFVYKYVKSSLSDQHIVEDVVADVFVKVLKNLKTFKGLCSLKTWIHKITQNEIYSQIKRNIKVRQKFIYSEDYFETLGQIDKEIESSDEEVSDDFSLQEAKLETVLISLKPNYAEILKMRYLLGMNIKECADVLGISENNVKVMQNRALKQAKKMAKNYE